MFRAQASLAAGSLYSIVGLIVLGLGMFSLQRGLRFMVDLGFPDFVIGLLLVGLVFIGLGGTSLGAGIRSFELFERKLLMSISSRGRVQD